MNANGLRFWMLADQRHFAAVRHAAWDVQCRVLRLASERTLTPALAPADAFVAAQAALENIPRAVDALECVASWDAASGSVVVKSYLPEDTDPAGPGRDAARPLRWRRRRLVHRAAGPRAHA